MDLVDMQRVTRCENGKQGLYKVKKDVRVETHICGFEINTQVGQTFAVEMAQPKGVSKMEIQAAVISFIINTSKKDVLRWGPPHCQQLGKDDHR